MLNNDACEPRRCASSLSYNSPMRVAKLPQHCVHARLISRPLLFEPFEDILVDSQSDLLLSKRHGQPLVGNRARPVFRSRLWRIARESDVRLLHVPESIPIGLPLGIDPSLSDASNTAGTTFPFHIESPAGPKCDELLRHRHPQASTRQIARAP